MLLALLLAISGMTFAWAESESEKHIGGDCEYILLEGGTAEITGCMDKGATLIIPAQLDGYAVSSIRDSAMERCGTQVLLIIPDGVVPSTTRRFAYTALSPSP